MLYSMQTAETTAAVPRVVSAQGLLHLQASKAARSCLAADLVDGLAKLGNPTLRLAAAACGVSIGSVARALRLTPEQRQAVRKGQRPLVLPRKPAAPSTPPAPLVLPALPVPMVMPATPPTPPVTMGPRERLDQIVAEIGLSATFDLLVATEKAAA